MTTELPVVAPPRISHRGRGVAFVLLAAVLFSTSGTLGKPAMGAGLTPEQVATFRIGFAGVVLLLGTALFAPRALRVRRGEWPMLLAYGLLGVAGTQLMYFIAADRVPVGIAILLEFVSPVLIALWVRVVRRMHLPRALWLGIGLAMVGLALIGQVWQGLTLDAVGLLAGLGAAVCSAGYFLIGERAVADRDPLGLVTWGMVIGAVIVSVVSPPWTIHWLVLGTAVAFGPWTPPIWLLLTGLVLLSTVFSYLLGISSLRHLPASVASVLGLLEPVAATAFAWALLGEALTWPQALGAAILLGGAYVVQRFSKGVT
ncbi:DMT family transporter [Amycolatopsis sp. FDAARGOS 1241]|uniref:EamA family transporter n=1 Tax=Amycolatopsis sp. FDAARGOS 1241 TaxID=2778070 RepID=UPI00194E003B|nr:EamA family transporter [Amycolatopsis sp. FDAARGOS 1241]QRP48729.1 EamA family transporter [Amycolatopsis sp. FDAARGOS 1241]